MQQRIKSLLANKKSGFTLLEILLVVAAIAILAGIVIIAINPGKQLADTRNAQREVDVNTILNAVYQYAIDNNGDLPGPDTIPIGAGNAKEICKTGAADCTGYVDISNVSDNEVYVVSIPTDPHATDPGTGYEIYKSNNGRVTVMAPLAEQEATISVTR